MLSFFFFAFFFQIKEEQTTGTSDGGLLGTVL